MVSPNSPFNQVYQQSELLKAGIRFDFNVVDTICKRKLGISWSLALLLLVILLCAGMGMLPSGFVINIDGSVGASIYLIAIAVLVSYIAWYALRLAYFLRLRHQLRQDIAPIAVEAYAVVCLDVRRGLLSIFCPNIVHNLLNLSPKYAVVYKEVGTNAPRFFLSAAVNSRRINYVPEQIGRVFLNRKNTKLYTLDDSSAYKTVSEKRYFAKPIIPSAPISQSSSQTDSKIITSKLDKEP